MSVCSSCWSLGFCWSLWSYWKDWWWATGLSTGLSGPVPSSLCYHLCSSSYCWWQFGLRTKTTTVCWESAGRPRPERSDKPSRSWRSPCTPTKTKWVYSEKPQVLGTHSKTLNLNLTATTYFKTKTPHISIKTVQNHKLWSHECSI